MEFRGITQDQFHEVLTVMIMGCAKDKAKFDEVIGTIFPTIPDKQRDFYWTSFHDIKGISVLLSAIGMHGPKFEETLNEMADTILKHAEDSGVAKDEDLPDGVTPITKH